MPRKCKWGKIFDTLSYYITSCGEKSPVKLDNLKRCPWCSKEIKEIKDER